MGFGSNWGCCCFLVELRTPLTLIQAPLEQMVGVESLPTSAKRKVELATRNVKRLRKLVDVSLFPSAHLVVEIESAPSRF